MSLKHQPPHDTNAPQLTHNKTNRNSKSQNKNNNTNPTTVYPSGTVCLSILNEDGGWKPSLTVSQVLNGVQELLDEPNPASPAQTEAYRALTQQPAEYARTVRDQARKHPPPS